MEEPYGFAGALNPTGHEAIYFSRICAETPVKLRRCGPGEEGAVIARYRDVGGYDWLAVPLLPYLYSVERASDVPIWADRRAVRRMRREYVEAHFYNLPVKPPGSPAPHGNWDELVGSSYDRRIYAFRFHTTAEQDDELISKLSSEPNQTHFSLVRNNCSDFAARIMDFYFPGVFHRRILPDARITTPRQNSWELVRFARKHPEIELSVVEIPRVPGSRRGTRPAMSVAGALLVSGEIAPLAYLSPPLAVADCIDYLVWGRYPLHLKHVPIVKFGELDSPDENALIGSAGEERAGEPSGGEERERGQ